MICLLIEDGAKRIDRGRFVGAEQSEDFENLLGLGKAVADGTIVPDVDKEIRLQRIDSLVAAGRLEEYLLHERNGEQHIVCGHVDLLESSLVLRAEFEVAGAKQSGRTIASAVWGGCSFRWCWPRVRPTSSTGAMRRSS